MEKMNKQFQDTKSQRSDSSEMVVMMAKAVALVTLVFGTRRVMRDP